MTTRSWIRQLFGRTPRRAPRGPRQAPPRFRPSLDVLEDRLTPSMLGTTALLEGPAAGSASDLVITSGPWSASSNATWLHTSATGTGNGLATFTFDANAGATRSGTLTVLSDSQATTNLQAQVDAAGLDHGIQNSLDSQLQAAIADFAAGDPADGASQLGAFSNHVSAQRGQQIDAALADAWIASAQRIINAVG